jgi:hypothetical protein
MKEAVMRKLVFLFAGLLVPAILTAQVSEDWVNSYNGSNGTMGLDAWGVVVDAAGYVYACGWGDGPSGTPDIVTLKYDPSSGETLWVRYYDGGNGMDYSAGSRPIAVDNSGGVYVTGGSDDPVKGRGFATIKYDAASGSRRWVARYDFPVYSTNGGPNAIAIDNSGGVYVTGLSWSSTAFDITTIKYNASDGSRAWDVPNPPPYVVDGAARYDGPVSGNDFAYDIAVDNSGGVYISGASDGGPTGGDFVVIKYNASDGGRAWDVPSPPPYVIDGVARYNGTGNGDEYGFAIAVDYSGGVYITGESYGSGTSFDFATVKYNASDGGRAWDVPSPPAHVVDGAALYDGPGNGYDAPLRMSVDNSGGVYVTGYSYRSSASYDLTTIRYNASDGGRTWDVANPPAYVVDGAARCDGPGNGMEFAGGLAVSTSGEVYVTGRSVGLGTSGDYSTIKYNPADGSRAWDVTNPPGFVVNGVALYNSPGDQEDYPYAIAAGSSGEVYVTGSCATSSRGLDIVTIRYGTQGPPAWNRWADVPVGPQGQEVLHGAAAATDPAGLYVYLLKGNKTCEFYRYAPATDVWSALDPIPEQGRGKKTHTVRDGGTLAQVNGRFYATKGGKSLEFWEYNPAALPGSRWTQKADVPAGTAGVQSGASATGVLVGINRYVYLLKASGTFEFYRYDVASDNWQAMATAPGLPGEEFDTGSSISFDDSDTVYALKGALNKFYAYVVSTNTWLEKPDLPLGRKNKQALGGAAICYHLRTVYCIKGGNSQEFWIYNCDTNTWAQGPDVALGPNRTRVKDGGALVYCRTSRCLFATKGKSLEFWSYGHLSNHSGAMSPNQGPVDLSGQLTPYRLEVWPTVVTGQTSVAYALPRAGDVELVLYDAGGRIAKTLVSGVREPGTYTARLAACDLARGVYILRYRSGVYESARKLVIE